MLLAAAAPAALPIAAGAALSGDAGEARLQFRQADSGAVVRTLEDKARDFVSVRDFGAKGDNSTDDTAAIAAALAALYRRNGGTLYFPSGQYLFTSFIIDRDFNVLLQGEGNSDLPQRAATVLRCTKRGGREDVAINVNGHPAELSRG